jgi:hypothetical protein
MNYFGDCDCFGDLYQEGCPFEAGLSSDPLLDDRAPVRPNERIDVGSALRIGPFPLNAVHGRGEKSYDVEVYEGAVRSFIQYLEEREEDLNWLLDNEEIVVELFDELMKTGDGEDLLSAIQILEQDPHFSRILDENALKIMLQHSHSG